MADAPDPAPAVEEQPHKRPPNFCSYCKDEKPWDDPREFGLHLERHREMMPPIYLKGKLVSTECPQKCGRHFFRPSHYREHVPLCNGETPLWNPANKGPAAPAPAVPPAKEQPVESVEAKPDVPIAPPPEASVAKANVFCPDCGAGPWMDKRGVAAHKRGPNCKTGATPKPAKEKKPTADRPSGAALSSAGIAEMLKAKAQETRAQGEAAIAQGEALIKKAEGMEKIAADLEAVLQLMPRSRTSGSRSDSSRYSRCRGSAGTCPETGPSTSASTSTSTTR